MMTPVHWEHSWNYFCRKLASCGEDAAGEPSAIFG